MPKMAAMDGAFFEIHLGAAFVHCDLAPVVQRCFRTWVDAAEEENEHIIGLGEDGGVRVFLSDIAHRA